MDIILIGGGVNAAATFLAAACFGWLYSVHQQDHLRSWAWGWSWASMAIGINAMVLGGKPPQVVEPLAQLLPAASAAALALGALYLLRGAYEFGGRRLPAYWWGLLSASVLISFAGSLSGQAPELVIGLPALLSEAGLVMCAVALLQQAPRQKAARVAAGGYLAMVANALCYPLLRDHPELLINGFLAAATLALITAGGMLVMHYDELVGRLQDSEQRYRDLFDNAFVGVFQTTPEGVLLRANGALAHTLGLTAADIESGLVNLRERLQDPADWAPLMDSPLAAIEGREVTWHHTNGTEVRSVLHARLVTPPTGPPYCAGVLQDMTEAYALRRQLVAARRFEALGGLASGVAHDFNNLLTVIIGELDLERARQAAGGRLAGSRRALDAIGQAADQASRLTRQLLAFGRGSVFEPVDLDLAAVVDESLGVLRRVIPANVTLEVVRPDTLPVHVDRASIEQLLTNLITNGCAAMPEGGRLGVRLTVDDVNTAGAIAQAPDAADNMPVVLLEISDEGTGMDTETQARMFEPFFTTKAKGRGTGLGLATVHGIVTQLGGQLTVHSEPGRGTTIAARLPLPAAVATTTHTLVSAPQPAALNVLVVEDQPDVRALTASILRHAGHRVQEAADGHDALELVRDGAGDPAFDAVVSDVIMPRLGGLQLARELRASGVRIPVLLVTGYAEIPGDLPAGTRLLQKPFSAQQLLGSLAEALHQQRSAA